MTEDENTDAGKPRPIGGVGSFYILAAVLAAIAGFSAVVLVQLWSSRSDVTIARPGVANPTVMAAQDGANGGSGMQKLVRSQTPQPVADTIFSDGEGKERSFGDWKGKIVLVNLWATWCAPCKLEMPSLDRLQAKLGGDNFAVVPISLDRTGLEKPREFLATKNLTNLGLFLDSKNAMMQTLRAQGLPLTVILDRQGREIARLAGPAEWDSAEAEAVIRALLAQSGGS